MNGYVTKDGITINMDSPKAWQSTVGHEITHVLEGTELYTTLQEAIFKYANRAGTFDAMRKKIADTYKNIEGADISKELTAELVGEYLFTDEKFVKQLSVEHRNVFQKIYDEIKYLAKLVTAGSKEARALEAVKHTFEKVYREGTAQKNTVGDGEVRYSLANIEDVTPSNAQREANIREVAKMGAVHTVDKSKLVASGKSLNEVYGEYFAAWGENIHSDFFGDVAAKKSSVRSEIKHGSTAEKIACIEAIPSVIKNGKIIDWIEKNPGSFRVVVAAPIDIGDTPYIMGVMLQRDSRYQRLYIHDVAVDAAVKKKDGRTFAR